MRTHILIIIAGCAMMTSAFGSTEAAERPKVGLVLSGGAARGFMHIGVIQVLEDVGMPIDYVTGCSMGAVIGGLYACGFSAAELESIAVHVDWDELFSDAVPRSKLAMTYKQWDARYAVKFPMDGWLPALPSGLIAGQNVTKLLDHLTVPVQYVEDFTRLPVPFVCVATDIETGEVVVLDHGNLTDAIRASMAIPSLFTPVVIGGRLLVDGGVVRNLPAREARDMGADIVIGVEANEPLYKAGELNSMMRIMDQAIHFQISGTSSEQRNLCDILIVPQSDNPGYEFDTAAYFVERGVATARAILPQLQGLADSLNALGQPPERWEPARTDSIFVTDVSITGLERVPSRVVDTELQIKTPLYMTLEDLSDAVDQLYKYDYFERVGYSVERSGKGSSLRFRVVERNENLFRAGLRYDSETELALLLNVTLRDLGIGASVLALDVRLGNDYYADLQYLFPAGRTLRSFGLSGRTNVSRTSIDVYEGKDVVERYRTTYAFGEFLLGNIYSSRLTLAAGLRGEYVRSEVEIGASGQPDETEQLLPFFGGIRIDTIDRTVFPTSGLFVDLRAEATSTSAGSDVAFTRYYLDQRAWIPLGRDLSLLQSLYLGSTAVGEPPRVYNFFLGGMHAPYTFLGEEGSFVGLERFERAGPHAQALGLGLQWKCYKRTYLLLRWNIGDAFEEWNTDFAWDRFVNGGGLTLGLDVPAAPVEATIMTSSEQDFMWHVTVGYDF